LTVPSPIPYVSKILFTKGIPWEKANCRLKKAREMNEITSLIQNPKIPSLNITRNRGILGLVDGPDSELG